MISNCTNTSETIDDTNCSVAGNLLSTHYASADLSSDLRILGALVGSALVLTGVPGNVLLMIVSLWKTKRRLNMPEILVFSLAVTDTYFLLVRGCLLVFTYITGRWTYVPQVCALMFVTVQMCHILALEHIVAISLARYLFVVFNKSLTTWYGTGTVLLLLYVVALGMTLGVAPDLNGLVFYTPIMSCFSLEGAARNKLYMPAVSVFSALLTVAVALLLCYLHIYVHVRRSRASVANMQPDAGTTNNESVVKAALIKREIKLIRTVAYVFGSFCLTYPVSPLMMAIDKRGEWPTGVHFIGVAADLSTACLNWVIYGVTNEWVRARYRKIITSFACLKRTRRATVAPAQERHAVASGSTAPPDESSKRATWKTTVTSQAQVRSTNVTLDTGEEKNKDLDPPSRPPSRLICT